MTEEEALEQFKRLHRHRETEIEVRMPVIGIDLEDENTREILDRHFSEYNWSGHSGIAIATTGGRFLTAESLFVGLWIELRKHLPQATATGWVRDTDQFKFKGPT